jgi:hypothetical protein
MKYAGTGFGQVTGATAMESPGFLQKRARKRPTHV